MTGRAALWAIGLVGFIFWMYSWDFTSGAVGVSADANRWRAVDHAVFNAVRYDAKQRLLFLEFHDGRRYAYEGVDRSTYLEFMRVPAKARYFNYRIRDVFWCRPEEGE